jgi:tRNA threonylcarbamoyladenosine biosynthesis protein TsaE
MVNENQLPLLAEDILKQYPDVRVFAFYGEMGSGKTTLIKQICQYLGVVDQTSSPTFAIINEYFTEKQEPVYHFDFYRVEKQEDLIQIGVQDYLDSGYYCFLEWPEIVEHALKENFVKVFITTNLDGTRCFEY